MMPRTSMSKVLVPGGLTVALFAFGSLALAAGKPSSAYGSAAAFQSQRVSQTTGSAALQLDELSSKTELSGEALQPLLPDNLALLTKTASLHAAARSTALLGGCSCPSCRRLAQIRSAKAAPFGTTQFTAPVNPSEASSY